MIAWARSTLVVLYFAFGAVQATPTPMTEAAKPGAIQKLGPLGLSVKDIDRSVRFYSALGFTAEGEKASMPISAAHALGIEGPNAQLSVQVLTRDGVNLVLHEATPAPVGPASPGAASALGLAHFELFVNDMDAAASQIRRHGGRVLEETRVRMTDVGPKPVEMMYARDPDGTLIMLLYYHP
jgi:catechol 2,3-dioxygenase-like lactoylglutathione lyase family enzyme